MSKDIGEPLDNELFKACVYLDYNATTPIYPQVASEMEPFLWQHFGNPSSVHDFAKPCKDAVALARTRVQNAVGAKSPSEIIFTSCGTESDNAAIGIAVDAYNARFSHSNGSGSGGSTPHVITSEVEHPAVLVYLEAQRKKKVLTYSLIPVDEECVVKMDEFERQLEKYKDRMSCVTVMHANNEIGAIQPVREIADLTKKVDKRIMVHTDAAQSFSKVRVRCNELNADAITIVGHKIGAPKGIAALYVRKSYENLVKKDINDEEVDIFASFPRGGGQEYGRRGGTENVMHIAGLGKAAQIADEEFEEFVAHTKRMRDLLHEKLKLIEKRIYLNGPKEDAKRLPTTLSIAIQDLNAGSLLMQLKSRLAASAGAACHSSDKYSISSVLLAMNLDESLARGTLRLSVGRHTTEADVNQAVKAIESVAVRQSIFKFW